MHSYKIKYEADGKVYSTDKTTCNHFKIIEEEKAGRLTAHILAQCSLKIRKFQIVLPYSYNKRQRIFVNGYQSWTESREYFIHERMDGFSRLKKWVLTRPFNAYSGLCRAGDAFFCRYPLLNGNFFGYSYGYIRDGKTVDLFASLSEKCGFTIIRFDVLKSRVIIEKDFDGVVFNGKMLLADFVHLNGGYDAVFDKWFEMMNIQCRLSEKMCGYTTWYNYYKNIDENIVFRDLDALSQLPERVDIFQIDDGYQKCVGDWLFTNEKKFPSGMKKLAVEIHSKNMLAGLWLAPFAATKDSFIYKEHKDWLVRYENGELYPAGANCAGDKLVLGCGVPLMPCFGKVDFCRVGADVALNWKNYPFCIREDVSTPNTVACSVFRRGLDGRAFLNDPDVFLLRDDNIEMSFEQRKLLAEINRVFGSLLFVSDNVSQYDDKQLRTYADTVNKEKVKVIRAEYYNNDIIAVDYLINGELKNLKFNYKNGQLC